MLNPKPKSELRCLFFFKALSRSEFKNARDEAHVNKREGIRKRPVLMASHPHNIIAFIADPHELLTCVHWNILQLK